MKRRFLYLYDNVPVPRRTLYRRRKEAEIAARMQQEETDSEPEVQISHQHFEVNTDQASSGDEADSRDSNDNAGLSEICDSSDETHEDASDHSSDCDVGGSNIKNVRERLHDLVMNHDDWNQDNSPVSSEQSESPHSYSSCSDESGQTEGGRITPPQVPEGYEDNVNPQPRRVLLDEQLCPCTTTTEGDAMLMCLALGMRHNMSWIAIVDILKMINVLFNSEVMHASKYYLQKFFDAGDDSAVFHVYCPKCELYLGTRASVTSEQIVQCRNCGEKVKDFASSSSYFVATNLKNEFKKFMELPGIAKEVMTYRFGRSESHDVLEDIFDGEVYKSFSVEGGLLSDSRNISVAINTDGMSLGMSTSQSAWPIYLSVNELSPQKRKKHLIFGGIWVSKKQPNMRVFLKPFVDNMRDLFSNGFEWKDDKGEAQVSRVLPLLSLLDSGARYKYLNLSSFSCYYGCTFCYQKAENTNRGRRFTATVEPAPLRTHDSMCRDMMIAHQNRNNKDKKKRIYKGCKGLTPLILLEPYHNLGTSMVVDYMHNALLGVTRAHIYLVLRVSSGKKFYIGEPDKMHNMNQRLLLIRPPKSITRLPRDLKDIKYWRATEWRSFLLFWGILCMDAVTSSKNLEHFSMLSAAYYILLQRTVPRRDLEIANKYLLQYVYLTQKYHSKTAMTYNIHLLLHVTTNVKNFGPLFAHNMFVFEGENRHLGQMMTSPGRVPLQLTRRYLILSAFPRFCEMYASSEKPLEFIEEITGRKFKRYLRCEETLLIGTGKTGILSNEVNHCLERLGIHTENINVVFFEKVLHCSIRYTTFAYSEGKKNDDSWIKVKSGWRGRIDMIVHVSTQNEDFVIFIVRKMRTDKQPILKTPLVTLSHIKRIVGEGDLMAVRPDDIIAQCIHMNLDTGTYIVDIPYGCYGD